MNFQKKSDEVSTFERNLDKKGIANEPETKSDLEEDKESKLDNTMANIETMMMEEYNRRMQDSNRSGLVPPAILAATNFELKGHILCMLKDISFFGKNHKDACKHIDEVLEIENYLYILPWTR